MVLGLGLIGAAYLTGSTESGVVDGVAYSVIIPGWTFLASGWFTLAFFAFHSWIPTRWAQS